MQVSYTSRFLSLAQNGQNRRKPPHSFQPIRPQILHNKSIPSPSSHLSLCYVQTTHFSIFFIQVFFVDPESTPQERTSKVTMKQENKYLPKICGNYQVSNFGTLHCIRSILSPNQRFNSHHECPSPSSALARHREIKKPSSPNPLLVPPYTSVSPFNTSYTHHNEDVSDSYHKSDNSHHFQDWHRRTLLHH